MRMGRFALHSSSIIYVRNVNFNHTLPSRTPTLLTRTAEIDQPNVLE
jgi:hypothetical protein